VAERRELAEAVEGCGRRISVRRRCLQGSLVAVDLMGLSEEVWGFLLSLLGSVN